MAALGSKVSLGKGGWGVAEPKLAYWLFQQNTESLFFIIWSSIFLDPGGGYKKSGQALGPAPNLWSHPRLRTDRQYALNGESLWCKKKWILDSKSECILGSTNMFLAFGWRKVIYFLSKWNIKKKNKKTLISSQELADWFIHGPLANARAGILGYCGLPAAEKLKELNIQESNYFPCIYNSFV